MPDIDPIVYVIAGAVVLLLLVVAVVLLARRAKRRRELKERFGSEYDRAVERTGSRKAGEHELVTREHERTRYQVRSIDPQRREQLRERWEQVRANFVESPTEALSQADQLLDEAATASGYPQAAREQRLLDLSLDHPSAVERYRSPDDARHPGDRGADTEQQREAMLAARSLFDEVLGPGDHGAQSGSTQQPDAAEPGGQAGGAGAGPADQPGLSGTAGGDQSGLAGDEPTDRTERRDRTEPNEPRDEEPTALDQIADDSSRHGDGGRSRDGDGRGRS